MSAISKSNSIHLWVKNEVRSLAKHRAPTKHSLTNSVTSIRCNRIKCHTNIATRQKYMYMQGFDVNLDRLCAQSSLLSPPCRMRYRWWLASKCMQSHLPPPGKECEWGKYIFNRTISSNCLIFIEFKSKPVVGVRFCSVIFLCDLQLQQWG